MQSTDNLIPYSELHTLKCLFLEVEAEVLVDCNHNFDDLQYNEVAPVEELSRAL